MKKVFIAMAIGFFVVGCASKKISPNYSNDDIKKIHHIAVVNKSIGSYFTAYTPSVGQNK